MVANVLTVIVGGVIDEVPLTSLTRVAMARISMFSLGREWGGDEESAEVDAEVDDAEGGGYSPCTRSNGT